MFVSYVLTKVKEDTKHQSKEVKDKVVYLKYSQSILLKLNAKHTF